MDHHTVAAISLTGIFLDVLGGLYLAYDLLGGVHGPLRLLTRAVTYSILLGIGYGVGLGWIFGVTAGVATGITMAIELNRTARKNDHYPLRWEAVFSSIRSIAFGAGLYYGKNVGLPFAVAFGVVITLGQIFAYSRGMRPGMEYAAAREPRFSWKLIGGSIVRPAGYTATALACSAFVQHLEHPWLFALRVGLVTGLVTTMGGAYYPFIEYYADNLPERRLGVFGIGLVLCGFALQSLQYWLAILDIPVS
jgi:hypothetical protein